MAAPDGAFFAADGRLEPDPTSFQSAGCRWPPEARRRPAGMETDGVDLESTLFGHTVLVGSALDEDRFQPVGEEFGSPTAVIYDVLCPLDFHQAVTALAEQRGVCVSALVRQVLFLVHPSVRSLIADPGAGSGGGSSAGNGSSSAEGEGDCDAPVSAVLTLSLDPGLAHGTIRQALAVALALAVPGTWALRPVAETVELRARVEKLEYRTGALVQALEKVSFRPRDEALVSVAGAARLLGLEEDAAYDEQRVTRRFRELAPIYHPDTGALPCRRRMAMLIDARKLLLDHLRRRYGGRGHR